MFFNEMQKYSIQTFLSLAGTIPHASASQDCQLYPEHQYIPSSRRCIMPAGWSAWQHQGHQPPPGCFRGATPLPQRWIQNEPLLPCAHFSSSSPTTITSYQHVHQPMAHVNHTNSETDLVKSAQSSSMSTHKTALQTAKMNLE